MPGGTSGNLRIGSQKSFWDGVYRSDPEFFGSAESPLAGWALERIDPTRFPSVLELGFGCGRDMGFFREKGFRTTGVELSHQGFMVASERFRSDGSVRLVESDAFSFLESLEPGSFDAVYSNLFLNMHFLRREHVALFNQIARVLRRHGVHIFSVRSTVDPWYGKGRPVARDTFDHSPLGSTIVYFSRATIRRVTPPSLRTLEIADESEGEGDFPISLLYALQERE